MVYQGLKKVLVSLALSGFILSSGLMGNAFALTGSANGGGQDRWWRQQDRREERERARREEREELQRVRRFDRDHRLRYRMNNSMRIVGFYDRFGVFHQYGYYDRFGFFHRF